MHPYSAKQLIKSIHSQNVPDTQKLLALFDTLDTVCQDSTISVDPLTVFTDEFTNFYLKQAKNTTAENPDTLAAHLLLVAQKALIDQLSGRENQSLYHAKTVAQALIQAQCKPALPKSVQRAKQSWFGITASALLVAMLGWYGWSTYQVNQQPTAAITVAMADHSQQESPLTITAKQASEMYHKYEMMRNGSCRFIEALQIPDEHKDIYIQSVVGGKLPKNLKDLAIANQYLEKIQCSYTPMLMKKST